MSSVFIDTKNQFLRTLELYGKDNYNLSDSQHGLKRIRLNRASYKGSLEILKALFINSLGDKLTETELRAILHDVASNTQSGGNRIP